MPLHAPLATRLVVPGRPPDLLSRGRLLDALTEAAERPLALVAAPAGAGKTALIAEWVRSGLAPGPVAWVCLDGEQAGRSSFWSLVFAAVAGALDDEGAFPIQGSVDAALVAFLNRLAGAAQPVVVVLDDFQAVRDEAVAADLDALLDHPPAALRLVIATRRDPALRLGRLRVADRLRELRARDLAFTSNEAVGFLTAALPTLAPGHARALWQRTEGWAAGLRMAELTLRRHPDPAAFVEAFTGADAAVADYLLTEVLDRRDDAERGMVLRIAIVDAVCGDLVTALTGDPHGTRTLRRLAGENAMLEPLEGRPGWFRFHPLLRDLLRAELRSALGGELAELHGRAARWLAADGRVVAATRHALAAGDSELASRMVAHGWVELFLEGGIGTLRALVASLSPAAVEREPELALAAAAVHVEDGALDPATAALDAAAGAADGLPPARRRQFDVAYATVLLRRARLHGQLEHSLAEARRLIGPDVAAVGAPGLSALALAGLGIAELWAGDARLAVERLESALGAADRSGHRYVAALALAHLALHDSFAGRHRRAFARASAAIEILEQAGWTRTSAAAAAFAVLGGIELLWDRPAAAKRTLDRAAEALESAPERALRGVLAVNRVRVLAALGEVDAAYATLQFERLALGDFANRHLGALLTAQEGLLLDALGDRERARDTLRRALVESDEPELRVALGRLLLADGAPREAIELVGPVTASDDAGQLLSTRVQAHAVEALARDALLDHDGAAAALELALDLAEPRGLRRVLSELGPALRPVLNRELRRETAHRALVGELLEALGGAGSGLGAAPSPHPSEPLSARELTILRFLPTMMSNQEIADELFVSLNTLKTHLKHIYRKLDATSRREAVDRARVMELLTPSAREPRGA